MFPTPTPSLTAITTTTATTSTPPTSTPEQRNNINNINRNNANNNYRANNFNSNARNSQLHDPEIQSGQTISPSSRTTVATWPRTTVNSPAAEISLTLISRTVLQRISKTDPVPARIRTVQAARTSPSKETRHAATVSNRIGEPAATPLAITARVATPAPTVLAGNRAWREIARSSRPGEALIAPRHPPPEQIAGAAALHGHNSNRDRRGRGRRAREAAGRDSLAQLPVSKPGRGNQPNFNQQNRPGAAQNQSRPANQPQRDASRGYGQQPSRGASNNAFGNYSQGGNARTNSARGQQSLQGNHAQPSGGGNRAQPASAGANRGGGGAARPQQQPARQTGGARHR